MNYIEFYKQGNYPDGNNKSSYLDFEQKMYGWTLQKERENGKKPLPFKDTYNNKNNRTPYQIYASQYKFSPKKSNPYKSQMRQDLNDEDEGQNIGFLNKFYGPKKIGEFFIEPSDIPKVSITSEGLHTWVNKMLH
jgi:hypothetical protein